MFKEMKPVLEKVNLHIEVSSVGDEIAVTIQPRAKTDKDTEISTLPLRVAGTAEEIDSNLPGIILKNLIKVVGFVDNVTEFEAALEKVKAEKKADADKKAEKKETSKSNTSTSKKEEAPAGPKSYNDKTATKIEKDNYNGIQTMYASAKKSVDPDMYNYLEKQCKAKAEEMGDFKDFMLTQIANKFKELRGEIGEKNTELGGEGLFEAAETPEADDSEIQDYVKSDPPVIEAPIKKTRNRKPKVEVATPAVIKREENEETDNEENDNEVIETDESDESDLNGTAKTYDEDDIF